MFVSATPFRRCAQIAQKLLCELQGVVWPEGCIACGTRETQLLCLRCQKEGMLPPEERLWMSDGGLSVYSWGRADGPWRRVIHGFKYNGQFRWPSALLGQVADSAPFSCATEALWVPVPLHPSRLRERGYNQTRLIAEASAALWGGSVENQLLRRVHASVSQTKLSAEERKQNVQAQFAAVKRKNGSTIKGARVILVDDVLTTGATLESCRAALESIGIQVAGAMTLLRAQQSEDDFDAERWGA